jgi:hypothetical protein
MSTGRRGPAPEVSVRIDELVLHGFDARDRDAIAAALVRELSRLITVEWRGGIGRLPAGAGIVDAVDAGEIPIARGAAPDDIAARLAPAIHAALHSTARAATSSSGGSIATTAARSHAAPTTRPDGATP